MNKITIIGRLTNDVETRTVSTSKGEQFVANFTVATNDRKNNATFFRVTAWAKLGELCHEYLSKGKKVCVVGSVSARAFVTKKGEARAEIDVTAQEVEFLSSKEDGMTRVSNDEAERVFDTDVPF